MAAAHGARVIRHPYNIGNGAAVKTGLRAARGAIVLLMDGDGQHPPAAIPRLLEHLPEHQMVVAARLRRTEAGWHRMLANRVYSWFASYVAQYRIEDLTSGFRAIHSKDSSGLAGGLVVNLLQSRSNHASSGRSGCRLRATPGRSDQ